MKQVDGIVNMGNSKTFNWGNEINVALGKLAHDKRKKQVVLVLEALANTYPEIKETIYKSRNW